MNTKQKTKVTKKGTRQTKKKHMKRKSKFTHLDQMFMKSFQTGGEILKSQSGGGYTIDVSTNIGNRPAIVGYADHAPPVYINGQAIFGEGINPVCGQQTGGKRSRISKRKMFR